MKLNIEMYVIIDFIEEICVLDINIFLDGRFF